MKPKHSAAALKQMALAGAIAPCEMRAFAAHHEATLGAANHIEFVEAFVLQLGAPEQHGAILALLATATRTFAQGKIANTPPDARQLTSPAKALHALAAQVMASTPHRS